MTQTIAALAGNFLKKKYGPKIVNQFNNQTVILKKISKGHGQWNGEAVTFPIRYQRNASTAAIPENTELPGADGSAWKDVTIGMKHIYTEISFTGQLIKASAVKSGAFGRIAATETEDATIDHMQSLNRQCFGDGTGKLATVTAAPGGTVLTFDSVRWFLEKQKIDIYTAGGAFVESLIVSDVDPTTNDITFTTNPTAALTNEAFIKNSRNAEILGLQAALSDSNTYLGVDRSSNAYRIFRGNRIDFAGVNSESNLQKAWDTCIEKGDGPPDWITGYFTGRRAYIATLTPEKRFLDAKLKGGFVQTENGLSFNGVPYEAEKDAPYNAIFFLKTRSFKKYVLADTHWDESAGGVLQRILVPVRIDGYYATLLTYCEIVCIRPNCNVWAYNAA